MFTQAVIMVALTVGLLVSALGGLLVLAIPEHVRALIGENCRGDDGRLNTRYVGRSLLTVADFYAGALFFPALLTCMLVFILVQVNEHLIPLRLVQSALQQAEWTDARWKDNLNSIPGDVSQEYKQWYVANGGTPEGARAFQSFLWNNIPLALFGGLVALVVCLALTSKSYSAAVQHITKTETERNRRRVVQRYLSSAERFRRRRERHNSSPGRVAAQTHPESPQRGDS